MKNELEIEIKIPLTVALTTLQSNHEKHYKMWAS